VYVCVIIFIDEQLNWSHVRFRISKSDVT